MKKLLIIQIIISSILLIFVAIRQNIINNERTKLVIKKTQIIKETNKQAEKQFNIKSERFITHCTITTYNPESKQCDEDFLITANGAKIDLNKLKQQKIKWCAISRDMLWCIPYGSTIHIEGHGIYLVVDTMNIRYNHCIDILQHFSQTNFRTENVKIILINKGQRK